jgi:hypothetical protein
MKKLLNVFTMTLLLMSWGGLANADNLPTLETGIQDQHCRISQFLNL